MHQVQYMKACDVIITISNLLLNATPIPLHSSKILNKLQSLKQSVQYIALKKLKSTEV